MNRGFISILTALIIGAVSLVTAGGVYTVVKINSLEKENERITEELVEQKEVLEQEIVLDQTSTTTEVIVEEEVVKEVEKVEVVEKKTPVITQQTKPAIIVPVEPVTPSVPLQKVDDTAIKAAAKKVEDRKAYDLYTMTSLKASGEIELAETRLLDAFDVIYENPAIAKSYAVEFLDLCSSAHEINVSNMPPKLSFWSEMYELYKLDTKESSLCKQRANISIQMIEYQEEHNYSGAANASKEIVSLSKESVAIGNLKIEQIFIVDKAQSAYFQD